MRELSLRADQQASEAGPGLSVDELVLAYLEHADRYYVKNGRRTTSTFTIRSAVKPLVRLYGLAVAAEFSPLKLKAVRKEMVEAKLSRSTVNRHVEIIRRMFNLGTENEVVRGEVYHALQAVWESPSEVSSLS